MNPERQLQEDAKRSGIRPAAYYCEKALARAEQRREVIRPIVDGGPPYRQAILKASREFNISKATLYRSVTRFESTRDLRALVPIRTPRAFRLPVAVLDVIGELFQSRYQTKERRISPTRFAKEVRLACKIRELRVPCATTVKRHLQRLITAEGESTVERRRGNKRAAELLTARQGSFDVERPQDIYEIDHTPLDIIVLSEATGLPIGRAYLTIVEDIATRMIAGIHVGLDEPSMKTVGLCLAHGILPKDEYLKRLGLGDRSWPIHGRPDVIHTDNAQEFIGDSLARFAQLYDIRLEHRPVGAPRFGGHVERTIRTIASEVHNWEGTTHSNVVERGEYDSNKHAILTLPLLEKRLVNFITGEYHNRRHSALGRSPLSAFSAALLADEKSFGIGLPRRIDDEHRLRLDLLPTKECTVQRDGITMQYFTYVGEVLSAYVGRTDAFGRSERFRVAYDPSYMNEVYFYAHDVNEYYTLRLRDESRPHISTWEAAAIRKKRRLEGKDVSEASIFETLRVDLAIAEDAQKQRSTMRQARRRERRLRVKQGSRPISFDALREERDINWDQEPPPIDCKAPV